MKIKLLKDITIPAGTIFHTAPSKTERSGTGHIEAVVGLSKDTSGSFTYFVGPEGSPERQQLEGFFEKVAED